MEELLDVDRPTHLPMDSTLASLQLILIVRDSRKRSSLLIHTYSGELDVTDVEFLEHTH